MELQQQPAIYNGNPQVEDGHTKIANELLDQIINIDFTKRQYKILLFIIRKTYGWNKTSDDISRSQIVEATGLSNPHVTTTIQELLNMNVLIIGTGTHAKNYKINKHYDTWRITETVTIPKTVTVTETVTITETVTENYQNGNNSLPKQYPQKTITKDNSNINTMLPANANNCPHSEIVSLYHEMLPSLPRIKTWTDKRKRLLQARWREEPKRQNLDYWKRFFDKVSRSDFLMGRAKVYFVCNLEWLVNSSNFVKVIEGNYDNR